MAPFGSMPFGSGPFGGGPFGVPGPPGGTDDGYRLTIGPQTDAIKYLYYNSYRLKSQANGRNTLSFRLLVADGFAPIRGQAVQLTLNGSRLFAGTIFSRRVSFLGHSSTGWLEMEVECVDKNAVTDRRLIGEVYLNIRVGDIFRDIVAKTLAVEGVTTEGVLDGPLVTKIVFNNIPVSQAFDQLYDLTGHYWNIDYYNVLTTGPRGLSLAPFALDIGVNGIMRDFRDVETLAQYRNSQLVDGGKGITNPRTERFPGDGETRTWTVEYPIYEKPTIDLDGVPVDPNTIGIRGLDEDKAFYWSKNSNQIGQDKDQAVIVSTDTIGITYRGLFDILTSVVDPDGIAERQAVEGGSGLYEAITSEDNLDGDDVVMQRGLGLLRRYSLGSDIEVETDRDGLAVGQQVEVTVAPMGITARLYLIMGMEMQGLTPERRRYRIQATTGELRGTFAEFWKRVFRRNPLTQNEGTVLQKVVQIRERVDLTEVLAVSGPAYAQQGWGVSKEGESQWG